MRHRSVIAVFALASVALAAPPPLSPELGRTAREKIAGIEQGRTKAGETIVFTEDELNSLLKYEYAAEMPAGVRDATVRLQAERATIRAYVDIGKLHGPTTGRQTSSRWCGRCDKRDSRPRANSRTSGAAPPYCHPPAQRSVAEHRPS